MKTTHAILKSQDLQLPKYNKHNILKLFSIGGDNLCDKKRKDKNSVLVLYFYIEEKNRLKISHYSIQQYQCDQVYLFS